MMYTIRIRLIACILLVSHSLMSCYNADIVAGQKKLTEKIQQEKQPKVLPGSQGQEERQQAQLSTFEQPIALSIPTTTKQEEDSIPQEPAHLTSAWKSSLLSNATQQAKKSLLAARVMHPGKPQNLQEGQADKEVRGKNQVKKQPHFFHPLHPIFTNRQSCQLQFTSLDLQEACVQDIHGRTFHLGVLKEDPSLRLQDLMAKGEEWRKYHIEVTFPEQDPRKQGYVRIGTGGLLGGMLGKKSLKEENDYIIKRDLTGAVLAGDLEAVKYLIEALHVNPSSESEYGVPPIVEAAGHGHLDIVKYLLESVGVSKNSKEKHGYSVLHIAVQFNQLPVVKYLIGQAKVDPEETDGHGYTPLYQAVYRGLPLDMIQYLVEEAHADTTVIDELGNTLLHVAARHGRLGIAKYLIEKAGANKESQNTPGNRPLHEAAKNGRLDIVKYLIEEQKVEREVGNRCEGCVAMATRGGYLDIVRYLIEKANFTQELAIPSSEHPLLVAALHDELNIVQYLVEEANVDPLLHDDYNQTALAIAKSQDHQAIVDYLEKFFKKDPPPQELPQKKPSGFTKIASFFKQIRVAFMVASHYLTLAIEHGVKWLGSFFSSVGKWWNATWDWLKNVGKSSWQWMKYLGRSIAQAAKSFWRTTKKVCRGLATWFKGFGRSFVDFCKHIGRGIARGVQKMWQTAKRFASKMGSFFRSLWGGISSFFKRVGNWFRNWWRSTSSFFKRVGKSIWNGLKSWWRSTSSFFKRVGRSIWNGLKSWWRSTSSFFKRVGRSIWNGLKSWWRSTSSFFKRVGRSIWNGLKSWWRSTSSFFKRVGKNIWNGLKSWWRSTSSFFKRMGRSVGNWFRNLWQGIKLGGMIFFSKLKALGNFLWKHKGKILIGVAIVAVGALAWWLIATYGAASGVGAAVGSAAKSSLLKTFITKIGNVILSKGTSIINWVSHYGLRGLQLAGQGVMKVFSWVMAHKGAIGEGAALYYLWKGISKLINQIPSSFATPSGSLSAQTQSAPFENTRQATTKSVQQQTEEGLGKQEEERQNLEEETHKKVGKEEEGKKQEEKEKHKQEGDPQKKTAKERKKKGRLERQRQEAKRKKLKGEASRQAEGKAQKQEEAIEKDFTNQETEVENLAYIKEEEKAYDELVKELTSPEFTSKLATEWQQAAKDLLNKGEQGKIQAQELTDGLAQLVKQMQHQHKYLNESLEEVHEVNMPERIQEVANLEKNIKATKASLAELCEKYNLPEPDLTPEPPINKETLKGVFNQVLDATVPGSELIKVLTGLSDSPQSQQEWLQLAVDTALDLMPGGKIFKFLKGNAAKLGVRQLESQLLKIAARKAKKAAKIAPQLLKKLQNILNPGGKVIGKQLGNDPTIRTIGKEEAEKIIKQLMDAGAKKASKIPPGYKGTWYELPGGSGFGVRNKPSAKSLKHGTPHTIDLDGLGLEIKKLKY